MGLKSIFHEEFYKPKKEWSKLYIEWMYNRRKTLLKLIRFRLAECKVPPKKIIIDRDAYSILKLHFEVEEQEEFLYGIPFEVTEENLPDYFRLEW